MGLAGPRKRRKISSDPNNTAWAKSKGFGHSQLLSQGWTPGEGLGRTNTSYGDGQPRGSANLVKAVFREDNLGLGAKTGSQRDNNHGLEILQGVLGRLNGKSSEVLEKEEKARRDVKCALYAEQRWGSLRFMHGGVLTGNTTLEVTSTPLEELPDVSEGEAGAALSGGSESIPNATSPEEADNSKALRRKEKKEKRERKEKKLKKSQKERRADADDLAEPDTQYEASEKAAKKERKRQKALQRQKEATESEGASEKEAVVKTESTPRSSGSNTPSSRFHVRQRYIQHKRMAMMDAKALSEILMGQS